MVLLPLRRGRPQKFGRPSRAVTLTLPEDIIEGLARLDEDLGRAVVHLAQSAVSDGAPRPDAELANYRDSAVIVTKPAGALERIPGVTLIPLPDGRALISLAEHVSVYEFELKLRDAVEEGDDIDARDRAVLLSIADILKAARSTKGIVVHQRSIIVLQSTAHRRIARA